ncbi:MAG: hypothetical protein OXU78_06055, partial [Deltaproteobacteria bacterium]|nr:hypothetical protein [Deltaproteobacteria bacterium]
ADPTASPPVVPAATDSMTITVDLIDDDVNEATETLTITGAVPGATGLRAANGGDVGYVLNGNRETVDVTDDDAIAVNIAAASGTDVDPTTDGIQVNEGSTVTLTVSLDHASAADAFVTVTLSIGTQANEVGQAANDNSNPDYTVSGLTERTVQVLPGLTQMVSGVEITAGNTSGDITIPIAADRLAEGAETLTVTMGGASVGTGGGAITLGSADRLSLIITANSAAAHAFTLAGSPTSLDEGDAATTFTITRSGPAITSGTTLDVTWTFGAGDTVAADFESSTAPTSGTVQFSASETTKTFTIDPAEDTLAEGGADGGEEFTLTLSEPSTLTEAIKTAEGGVQVVTAPHRVQIVDPDDALVIAIDGTGSIGAAAEDTSSSTRTLTWRISVTGATSTATVNVPFNISGTGITAADYNITGYQSSDTAGEIEIPAGMGGTASNCASCGTVIITVTDDNLIEGDETITLVLETPTGGGGPIGLSAQVVDMDSGMVTTPAGGARPGTITDDESGTVSVARTDTDGFTENEAGAAGTAIFEFTLAGGELSDVATVNFTVMGCGGSNEDCDAAGTEDVEIAVGQTQQTFTITHTADDLNEADETITVTITDIDTTGTVSPSATNGTVTADLADDDELTVTAALGVTQMATADEGDSISFRVTATGAILTGDVTVPFTIGGTGITAGDYDITAPSG